MIYMIYKWQRNLRRNSISLNIRESKFKPQYDAITQPIEWLKYEKQSQMFMKISWEVVI